MQKKSTSKSGLFNIRTIFAVALCSIALSLGWFSVASTPSTGTISVGTPVVTYTAGPFNQSNPSPLGLGQLDSGPRCNPANAFPCDSFDLKVNLPTGYTANTPTGHPQASVKVTMSWIDAGAGQSDYDLYIFTGTVADSSLSGGTAANYQSASGSNPEVAAISPLVADGTDHHYTIKIVPYTASGETLTVRIELLPGPLGGGGAGGGPFGGADATAPGTPRFMIFEAPHGSSAEVGNGEFNIGFNPMTKRIMNMNSGPIWRITPHEVLVPGAPECCEGLWEDKSSTVTDTGLDPILWTDQVSHRTFASNSTVGANAVYAYSDDDGDNWIPFGVAAPNGGADHQTIGSGPYPASLSALTTNPPVPHANYGRPVYFCSQDIVGPAACYRSDDQGFSWGASTLAYNGQGTGVPGGTDCGGLHGHVHVAPDGTVWLPVNQCVDHQGGAFSTNGGITWTEFKVPTSTPQQQGADPSIAIDANSTIYYAYVNNHPVGANPAEGHARVAVGNRIGNTITWGPDTDIGRNVGGTVLNGDHGIVNAAEIEAVGGNIGRAAVGFLGTDQPGDYQAIGFPGKWYAFISTTYDGGAHWTTVNATPNDPVQSMTGIWQQGGGATQRNLLDFNEITIDDRGRVLYGYSDGCVTSGCIAGTAANDFVAFMRVARQTGGKSLFQSYDGSTDTTAAIAPKQPCLSGTRDNTTAELTWKAPDNGGANIVGYQIYRGLAANSLALVATTGSVATPNSATKFTDSAAAGTGYVANTPHYFYAVKAINAVGVGGASQTLDLAISIPPPLENICAIPGVTLFTDPAGDSTASIPQFPAGGPTPAPSPLPQTTPGPGMDILSVHVSQPYAPSPSPIKLVFTMNTDTGIAAQLLGTGWFIALKIAGNDPATPAVETSYYRGVRMEGTGTGVAFYYYTPGPNTSGTVDGRFVDAKAAAQPDSSYDPANGKITIVVNASDLTLSPGSAIQGFVSGTSQTTDLIGIGAGATEVYDFAPDSGTFTPVAGYAAVNPNSVCAPNTAPIAILSAIPLSGDPPLLVTFTPSGIDADAGDTIASYTIDFGDGSVPETHTCSGTCPTVQHTYTKNGDFGVQLKVTDSRTKISNNTALVNIGVETPLDRVVSQKAHNGVPGSPFPVILYDRSVYPNGNGEIECRTPGPENDYTIIFTLGSEFGVTGSASSVTVDGSTSNVNSHTFSGRTYTVHVKPAVPNAQHHTININGMPVHNTTVGAPNGGNATLNNVGVRFDLLQGDINGNTSVSGSDVNSCKAQVGAQVTAPNFRNDVNANGSISGSDVNTTKAQVGQALP